MRTAGHQRGDRPPEATAAPLIAWILDEIAAREPLFVGLDCRSGSGTSTLASVVQREFGGHDPALAVTVLEGDQSCTGGSASTWSCLAKRSTS